MSDLHPWLSLSAEPAASSPAPLPSLPQVGPMAPQPGVPAPSRRIPSVMHQHVADLWWMGTHGGAGETTLAGLVPSWPAAEHSWPCQPVHRSRVVLVARSSAHGLKTAQAAAMQWAAGLVPHVDVLGLVVVPDAPGRLPKPLRDLMQVVAGGVPRMWSIPWVEAWRLDTSTAPTDLPREVRRVVSDLAGLVAPDALRVGH